MLKILKNKLDNNFGNIVFNFDNDFVDIVFNFIKLKFNEHFQVVCLRE